MRLPHLILAAVAVLGSAVVEAARAQQPEQTGPTPTQTPTPTPETQEVSPPPPVPIPADAASATLRGVVKVPPARPPVKSKSDYEAPVETSPADPQVAAIWIGSGAPPLDPAKVEPVRIRQEGIQFRPGTLVVQVGTPVIFPNEDQVLHAVRSQSAAKKFNVGRYMKGEDPPAVVFDKPGYVFLLCEVHEHMQGHLLVVDTPYSTTSDAKGAFEVKGIPPGKYTVTIWRGRKDQETREITLEAGKVLEVDWMK